MIKDGTRCDIRRNGYDLLKIFLALQVIFSHSWELLDKECYSIFNRSPGNVAVHAFFVLSGYFITMSMKHAKSTGDYVWKRIVRLLPAYLLVSFAAKIMASLCNGFLTLPVPHIINGSVWTLYYEIVLYIGVMLLNAWGLLRKEVVGGIGVVLFLTAILRVTDSDPLYSIVLPMIFMFVAGSLIYLCEEEKDLIRMGPVGVAGLFLVQFFPNLFHSIGKAIPLIYGPDIWYGASFLVYLLSMPLAALWIGQKLDVPRRHIPDVSYGLYLFGWPVQQTIIFLSMEKQIPMKPIALFAVSSFVTAVFAFVLWYAVEKPAQKTKNLYWKISCNMKEKIKRPQSTVR